MRPLISVLIPVYQVEGYLGRCLDSVLAQTYPDLEICMVDDGPAIETLYRLAVRHGADIVQCKMGHTGEDAMPPMDIDNPDERVYPDREQVMVAKGS